MPTLALHASSWRVPGTDGCTERGAPPRQMFRARRLGGAPKLHQRLAAAAVKLAEVAPAAEEAGSETESEGLPAMPLDAHPVRGCPLPGAAAADEAACSTAHA